MIVIAALALTGCTASGSSDSRKSGSSLAGTGRAPAERQAGASVFPDSVVAPLIDAVPAKTVKALPAARLADDLLPPTNRWFSGLVFGEPSMPVFPLPLSFQLTDGGFAFGVPAVASEPKVIMGGFTGQIGADVGADSQVVTAYDTASVTISQRAGETEIGTTVIAEGSPFVTFTAKAAADVALTTALTASGAGDGDGVWTVTAAGRTYGLVSPGQLSTTGTTLSLAAGETAVWFALADGGSVDEFAEAARHPITGTQLDYALDGESATTSITYITADGGDTLVAAMPHQTAGLAEETVCAVGTWPSIYGELKLCAGSTLAWSVTERKADGTLDLSSISADDRERLAEQVRSDVASTPTFPADTYYGGKALARAANLLTIATQVGADDAASAIKARVVTALDRWMEPAGCAARELECFVYDAEAKGMVGLAASFGSEEFNDHHFHYGYFLYAAAVLAADDPARIAEWGPVMNLLGADLATSGSSTYFPEQRVFDAYAGHSWASGTSPFGDGNNQESSSEAVAAWNGLALWAEVTGQSDLETEATWMLSAEAASSNAYWTNFPLEDPVYAGFDHTITSLVWGGKRDYATWFSPEPSAMLGILILPLSPVSDYLAEDPSRITVNLDDASPNGFDVLFGDYLLMYSALRSPADAASALAESKALPEDRIDQGNSRSYLLAWIMSRT